MESRTNKAQLRTALSMGSRLDTTLAGLDKERNLPKETTRMQMRQHKHRPKRMLALSRGSRLDTILTGLSRQGVIEKEMAYIKKRKLAQQPSRKPERTHANTNCKERMRDHNNLKESRDTTTPYYNSRQK